MKRRAWSSITLTTFATERSEAAPNTARSCSSLVTTSRNRCRRLFTCVFIDRSMSGQARRSVTQEHVEGAPRLLLRELPHPLPIATQRPHQKHRRQQPLSQNVRREPLAVEQSLLRGDHVRIRRGATFIARHREIEHPLRARIRDEGLVV